MAIQRVGVVGCGLMGSGIAQVCAAAGFPTVVREVSADLLDKGLKGIEKNLNRLVEKGAITEAARSEIRGRLNGTTSLEDLKNADLIVANDVSAEGTGFDGDTNIVTLFSRDGRDLPLARMSKSEVAHRILDEVLRLRGVLCSKPASHGAGD